MMCLSLELHCQVAAAVQNGGKLVIGKEGATIEIIKQINKKIDGDST
jgi:predicted RNA-binding protein YlqC (UPF0109 family)